MRGNVEVHQAYSNGFAENRGKKTWNSFHNLLISCSPATRKTLCHMAVNQVKLSANPLSRTKTGTYDLRYGRERITTITVLGRSNALSSAFDYAVGDP
jgi:hypothetical protein